jgi:hypothetical protein
MPTPVGLVIVVVGVLSPTPTPPTPDRLIPPAALFVEEIVWKRPSKVPVVKLSACPLPLRVVSRIFSVPKPVPLMSAPVVSPNVVPQISLLDPRFNAFVAAAAVVMVGFVPPVGGRRLAPEGAVRFLISRID